MFEWFETYQLEKHCIQVIMIENYDWKGWHYGKLAWEVAYRVPIRQIK